MINRLLNLRSQSAGLRRSAQNSDTRAAGAQNLHHTLQTRFQPPIWNLGRYRFLREGIHCIRQTEWETAEHQLLAIS